MVPLIAFLMREVVPLRIILIWKPLGEEWCIIDRLLLLLATILTNISTDVVTYNNNKDRSKLDMIFLQPLLTRTPCQGTKVTLCLPGNMESSSHPPIL